MVILTTFELETFPDGYQYTPVFGVYKTMAEAERADAANKYAPVSGVRESELRERDGRRWFRCLDRNGHPARGER